ncbi:MAG TPA: bidirectional hydrogenase complex protein HoxE [Aggregatilineales bacterium]|nr:bidirectional hydrogenase complex protein HoxE [Aggregatilineales bacterium]
MPDTTGMLPPPSEDKRWRLVGATMRKNGYSPDALIETLHTAQESFGFLDDVTLRYVASALHVPLSRAYGVATFYHFFLLKPQGSHACVVCLGTACYIKGAKEILTAIEERYDVDTGDTTADGKLSLLTARCLGSCSLAPAAVFDTETLGKLTPDEVLGKLETLTAQQAPEKEAIA